jgi:hypothetical protein
MSNPHRDRPFYTFWKRGATNQAATGVDPFVPTLFTITRDDFNCHCRKLLCSAHLPYVGKAWVSLIFPGITWLRTERRVQ